jgi:cell fate (sporulation/competence/biofilm development) regulator YmcA (YheA/YmcA/DUF963 family)
LPAYGISYIAGKFKDKSNIAKKVHQWSKDIGDVMAFPAVLSLYAMKGGYHQLMAEYNYWKYKRLKNKILKAIDIKDYKNHVVEIKDRKQLEKILDALRKNEKEKIMPGSYKRLMDRLETLIKNGKKRIRLTPDEFETLKNIKKDLKQPIVKDFKKHVNTLEDMGLQAGAYRQRLGFNISIPTINSISR